MGKNVVGGGGGGGGGGGVDDDRCVQGHPTAKTFAALERATNGLFSLADYLGGLSVEQRTVIGFPALGCR
eukprot:COSAG01_NODE_12242_length_1775_cov_1.754177_2_plen_70_part_00